MADKPILKPGEWINLPSGRDAIVSMVYEDTSWVDIEVVYLDDRDRAINEDMVWKDGKWQFKISGPCGGYADHYDRLRSYVAKLRRGRY